jgi:hypothetical protein
MRIAFHTTQLCLRGSEIGIYNYADHLERLTGHSSVAVIYDLTNPNTNELAVKKFSKRFNVVGYEKFEEVDSILDRLAADRLHTTKVGKVAQLARDIPTLVHEVFPRPLDTIHGHRYAFVSEWLSNFCSAGAVPWVPGIIDPPSAKRDLREALAIPADAFVVANYSGEFDIPFIRTALIEAMSRRSDLYAIFMNVTPFSDHFSMRFLPGTADLEQKSAFIMTSDAMLHARLRGETFGFACAEFSVHNKPIMTYALSPERSHLEILGAKALVYSNQQDLVELLVNLTHNFVRQRNWDCYSARFSPESVIKQFASVFLD